MIFHTLRSTLSNPFTVGFVIFAATLAAVSLPPYHFGWMAFQQRDQGNAAYQAGDYHQALKYHLRANSIVTSDPYYRLDLARTYAALDQHHHAITQYTKALDIQPGLKAALCRPLPHLHRHRRPRKRPPRPLARPPERTPTPHALPLRMTPTRRKEPPCPRSP